MRNIIRLFDDVGREEFIRAVVFDKSVLLCHIRDSKSIKTVSFDFNDINDLFSYLAEYEIIPIEVIISSKTMFCKSIVVNKLRESDVISLATSMLSEKKETVNIVCYEKKLSYRTGDIVICDMKVDTTASYLIQKLLKVKNLVLSASCWPIWIVSSYFDMYNSDLNKFSASLFVIEYDDSWEMVVFYCGCYTCYRRGNIENFDRKIEIENTLMHINKTLKIDPNDVVVYSIAENTILCFTANSPVDMRFVSTEGKFEVSKCSRILDRIVKFGGGTLFLTMFICTITDVFKVFEYQRKIESANNTMKSVDTKVLNEAALWKDINQNNVSKKINFKKELRKNHNTKKNLKKATVKINTDTNEVTVNTIHDE
ncbi:MAG: hypothetical protein LBT03_01915 [Holosporales bacterium]|jgi:hypothetical protein|nr:hypothetical protein [Holosporales bacterium]